MEIIYLSSRILLLVSVFSFSPVVRGATFNFNNHTDLIIPESHEQRNYRNSKWFPLFPLIRFTNVCRTTSGESGICHTRSDCTALGGLAQGKCTIGVCCNWRSIARCGAMIKKNCTEFQNPNYPSTYTPLGGSEVCQVRIRKQPNLCQLRLNFIAFDVEGPAPASAAVTNSQGGMLAQNDVGVCKTDSLVITTSSGAAAPSLCGNMNGQHVYVDFGSSDTITLNLLLGGNNQRERTWNIEILTIQCDSISRAPSGCLQYFTGVSGQVESFNLQGGMHLANLDYSICVRLEDGMRSIDICGWSGGMTIPSPPPTANMPCISGTGTGVNSTADYLVIPSGISFPYTAPANTNTGVGPTSHTDRFCDKSFYAAGSYIRSYTKPFLLHVKTDMAEGGALDLTSVGYCFRWQQNPQ